MEEKTTVEEELLATQKRQLAVQEDMALTLERDIQSSVEVRELQKQELEDSMAYRADIRVIDKTRQEAYDRREEEKLQLVREDMVLRRGIAEDSKTQTRLLQRIADHLATIARTR